jgi:DNA-binding transcriptional regulator YhcF (GntR family)
MCQALLEIMEPEIMKIKEETRQETMREAILRAVEGFRDLGADDDRIKEILKKKYAFSDEEAEKYL